MGTEQQGRTPPMVAMPMMLLMILAMILVMMAAPCQAKAFTQRSFLDFISGAEAFQGDDGSAEGALIPAKPPVKPPIKPATKPSAKYPVQPAVVPTLLPPIYEPDGGPSDFPCPFGCMCQVKVMHCSGVGLKKVPANLPPDLLILDLQNNKISELCDGDFDGLKVLQVLILAGNNIESVSAGALAPLARLERLHLSRNRLVAVPPTLPPTLLELRLHENRIAAVGANALAGLSSLICFIVSGNPLGDSGMASGGLSGLRSLAYLRASECNLTAVPQGLPPQLQELYLDSNAIKTVRKDDLKGLTKLTRLGLSDNAVKSVAAGALDLSSLRELHLDHNELSSVPPGFPTLKRLQVIFLHDNKIASIFNDSFCPPVFNPKKALYTSISLFGNALRPWEVPASAFSCISGRAALHLGNYRK